MRVIETSNVAERFLKCREFPLGGREIHVTDINPRPVCSTYLGLASISGIALPIASHSRPYHTISNP